AFSVYYAPSGIFSLKHDSLEDLPDGAQISLPVDTANNGRGIKILADAGLLEVDESVPSPNYPRQISRRIRTILSSLKSTSNLLPKPYRMWMPASPLPVWQLKAAMTSMR